MRVRNEREKRVEGGGFGWEGQGKEFGEVTLERVWLINLMNSISGAC